MTWTAEARRRALQAVLTDGLQAGLLTEEGEVSQRQPVGFGEPEDGVARNAELVRFPPFTSDGDLPIMRWLVADADGTILVTGRLERPRLPMTGDVAVFLAGEIEIALQEAEP